MEIFDLLNKTFAKIDLSWIDQTNDIRKSQIYSDLLLIFPNLENIFEKGWQKDKEEFGRTLKHILRAFKIYFLIENNELSHDTLSSKSIEIIRNKITLQDQKSKLIFILILMYHDIGKLFDKYNHPHQSFLLIISDNLLDPFNLSDNDKLLVNKVIQYHLLFATIFTGESTFYGVYSLLNDLEFIEILSNKNNVSRFLNLLEIFTIIDILGYPYTQIFDHYLKYYEEINFNLNEILNLWPDKEKALNTAKQYSQKWLKWRIAGALRIFQFVETKPYLTKEFYFYKLKESIKESHNEFIYKMTWKLIKDKYLVHSYKIQMKYSLAFLMILAFGNFKRMGLKINATISYKLLLFWTLLSKEVKTRSKESPDSLWNIFLEAMPHWSKIDQQFINKINDKNIELLIRNSRHEFNVEKKEFSLYLDFKKVLE
ncbi:MAG: hypothetical protein ACFFEY_07255 [Candidatus Thorarchaeota archaeon]